jgi:hypothetical protein
VLGVILALLTLVPLAHASPPDPVWIPGVYDAADFDEVVWVLTSTDTISPPVPLTGTAILLTVSVITGVGVSTVVAVVSSTVRPRSPPRI